MSDAPRATIQERLSQRKFRNSAEAAYVSLVYAADRLSGQVEEMLVGFGLTGTQYNILRILRGVFPDGHPRYEIAQRMMTKSPDVTRLLDRLEREELIARGADRNDRRCSIATITEKGLALLAAVEPQLRSLQERTVGQLSESEAQELVRLCNKVLD
jgi:DNA-binding MarR family transcriptional regulator